MSGTSLDAVDVAAVEFGESGCRLHGALEYPLPDDLRTEILALSQTLAPDALDRLGRLDQRLGQLFAEAAGAMLEQLGPLASAVRAIGSHGQTLRHAPYPPHPFTLQIGDPNLIAEHTGLTTVADFRRRDIAAGGEGAPLVPAFHAAQFQSPEEARVVLNIGGIANLTWLPKDPETPVTGFDTGPGNMLIDGWIQHCRQLPFDRDGTWAASGRVDEALLAHLLDAPFFEQAPPKSTGRELFNLDWLQTRLAAFGREVSEADVQATLTALTAEAVARALRRWTPGAARILVCGGGARNPALMLALRERIPDAVIETTGRYGLEPEWVEAVAFAWLARRTLDGEPGNLPAVTGARGPRILGAIYR